MLGKYAASYIAVVDLIDRLAEFATNSPPKVGAGKNDALTLAILGREPPLEDSVASHIAGSIRGLVSGISSRMTFPSVVAQSRRLDEAIKRGAGAKEVAGILVELKSRLRDELEERQFYYVPPERLKFYQEPMQMGKEVNDRFPKAIDDIEDAGKCLALGQATACVLHVMRILEEGLKALAGALNIPYAPSWESYLTQISAKIATKHKNKTKAWKRDEKFYRDLSGDLLIVKQAFRNPTMHVDRKYNVEEAEQIFAAAKTFMVRLSEHFTSKDLERLAKKGAFTASQVP